MRTGRLIISIGVLAPLLAVSLVPTSSTPAYAQALQPNDAGQWALSLPSSVLAAAGNTPLSRAQLANLVPFNWDWTDPAFEDVAGYFTDTPSSPGAVLSSSDLERYNELKTSFAPPATGVASVVRPTLAPGVGAIVLPAMVGLLAGQGAARLFFGFTDSQVCAQQNDALTLAAGLLDGVDCQAFDNALEQSERNADLVPVQTFDPVTVQGVTVEYLQGVAYPGLVTNLLTCFRYTGIKPAGYKASVTVFGASGSTNQTGTNESNGYCPSPSNLSGWWVTAPLMSYQVVLLDNTYPRTDPPYSSAVVEGEWGLPDPLRQWRCTVTTSTSSYSALSATFHESSDILADITCPTIPDGSVVTGVVIEQIVGSQVYTVLSQLVTVAYTDWFSEFGQCTNGSCLLDLRYNDESCFLISDFSDCANWLEDTTDFGCWIGTVEVSLSQCNVYATAFNYGTPSSGGVYADPETGDAVGAATSPDEEDLLKKSLFERLRANKGFVNAIPSAQSAIVSAVVAVCMTLPEPKTCRRAVYAPGVEYPLVSEHNFEAIVAGQPNVLTYVPRDVRVQEISPGWYANLSPPDDTTCTGAAPTGEHCDEYPYFSTDQSGLGASLRYVPSNQNTGEGGFRGNFYFACGFAAYPRGSIDRSFVVVPTVILPSAWWCAT